MRGHHQDHTDEARERIRLGNKRHGILDDGEYPAPDSGLNRRCIAVNVRDGMRCRNWAIKGFSVCRQHGGHWARGKIKMGKYSAILKSKKLRDLYEEQLEAGDVKDLRDEIALMRTFVHVALAKVKTLNIEDLAADQMAVISIFIRDVGNLVEQMSRVEQRLEIQITAVDMKAVMGQLQDIISKHVTEETALLAIAKDIEELAIAK